jgi:hypothetical protein
MKLNTQIIPFAGDPPPGANIVLLPAHEWQTAEETQCPVCGGTGKLPRRGDVCRKCGGQGKAQFIRTLRWEYDPSDSALVQEFLRAHPPHPPAKVQTTIRLHETGTGRTNTGHAQVVCGLRGEKLRSFWGRSVCGGPHATFYVHAALIISYRHHRGDGHGHISLVAVGDDHASITEIPLWTFDSHSAITVSSDHAERLVYPVAAIDAAIEKSTIYHCRRAVYADGVFADGPSGALRGAGAAFGGYPSPLKGPGPGYNMTL